MDGWMDGWMVLSGVMKNAVKLDVDVLDGQFHPIQILSRNRTVDGVDRRPTKKSDVVDVN